MKKLTGICLLFFLTISLPIQSQSEEFTFHSELAKSWLEEGSYFEWTSTTKNNNGAKVNIFYRTWGDPEKPQLLPQ